MKLEKRLCIEDQDLVLSHLYTFLYTFLQLHIIFYFIVITYCFYPFHCVVSAPQSPVKDGKEFFRSFSVTSHEGKGSPRKRARTISTSSHKGDSQEDKSEKDEEEDEVS